MTVGGAKQSKGVVDDSYFFGIVFRFFPFVVGWPEEVPNNQKGLWMIPTFLESFFVFSLLLLKKGTTMLAQKKEEEEERIINEGSSRFIIIFLRQI